MGVTILRNASVLDPERGELAEGQSVAVEDGRIADVGPGLTGPDDALVIDVAGRTVMPGLIDAHTHPAIVDADIFAMAEWSPTYVAARAGRALEGMLLRGFTTIRDVGAGEFGLARAVDEGYFTGPRMRFGGKQLSQTGGAGDWRGRRPPGFRPHTQPPGDRGGLGRGAERHRGGGRGREHLRGRARVHVAGDQPRPGVRGALDRAWQPDGREQHPAVQEARRVLRADDRHLPEPGP